MAIYQRIPGIVTRMFPGFIWKIPNNENKVFLTFDDGPHPVITPWVLSELNVNNQKATFFCVGENAERYPEVINLIKENGHSLGNHTYHHMKGWGRNTAAYVSDVKMCSEFIPGNLFRPPYGRITSKQAAALRPDYSIVMWNLLSADFVRNLNIERSAALLERHTKAGSIVVFHDSLKAENNLRKLLPAYLNYLNQNNFICAAL